MPLCASAMVAGSLSSQLIPLTSFWIAASLLVCAALLAPLFFLTRRSAVGRAATGAAVFFVAGLTLALAFMLRTSSISVPTDRAARILCEGEVISSPRRLDWGAQADVRLVSCAGRGGAMLPAHGAARVSFGGEGAPFDLKPGDVVRFRASYGAAREMKNPGSFSYRSYLASRGIAAVGSAYGKVERVIEGSPAAASFENLRRRIADSIAREISSPARDVVTALATGERGGIAPEVKDDFAESGLAHLMAISGLHVGFVATAVFLLFRVIFRFFPGVLLFVPQRRLSAFATVPAVWCYVMLTGSPVSAVRAGIMITVFMAGVMWGLRQDILSTLAVAVVVILFSSPLSTLDVSFQLSVAAVAGIALLAPNLPRFANEGSRGGSAAGKAASWLLTLLAVSAAATLATAPLVAWHFKFVAGLSLLANVVAVPAFGALLAPLVALASGVAAFSPEAASLLWKLSGVSATLFIRFAGLCSEVGRPLLVRLAPTPFELVLAYALLLAVVFRRRLPYKRAAFASLATLFLVDAVYWRVMPLMDDRLTVTVMDVGQGDSSLVRFPGGATLLIDGGGIKGSSFDVGKNVLAPALWRMGVRKLDYVVLTHPHYDHYRGLGYVAKEFSPGYVVSNGLDAPAGEADDWREFLSSLEEARVPLVDAGKGGLPREIGGVELRVTKPRVPEGSDLNDTSLVVSIRHGKKMFLFTGDLAQSGEAALLKTGEELSADFLKVGHHGSADASSKIFLDAVRPSVAAISAGEHNRYGLPAKDALARIEASGAAIYRTDRDGAITVTSDGETLSVETFVSR